jgi:hypothetical protein
MGSAEGVARCCHVLREDRFQLRHFPLLAAALDWLKP